MTLWIDRTDLEASALKDLRVICRDPGMEIEAVDLAKDKFHSGRVRYDPAKRTLSSLGCKLVADLVDLPQQVCIAAREPSFPAVKQNKQTLTAEVALRRVQGFTGFKTEPIKAPLPAWAVCVYDPTDDDGSGYYVISQQGGDRLPVSSDEILYHELCHARAALRGDSLGSTPGGGWERPAEAAAVAEENQYRAAKGRPARAVEGGGSGYRSSTGCFVASAAYGSPLAPEVQQLREFRDEVLLASATGKDIFTAFYAEYFRFSPAIATAIAGDPQAAFWMRTGIVAPLLSYFRLARSLPYAPLDDVPEPWRAFLVTLVDDFQAWVDTFPLPERFEGLTEEQKLHEVAALLRHLLREPVARDAWLRTLTRAGELPLALGPDAAEVLAADGCTPAELALVLGPRAPRPRTALSHLGESDFPADGLNVALHPYTVRIRNATPITFDRVVLFYKRRDLDGVVFLEAESLAPNGIDGWSLGAQAELESYVVGFFLGDRMVARLPEDGGEMTRTRAATIDPDRPDDYTDSWAIVPASLLPLSNLTYTVEVYNYTPDVWDEVAVSYKLEGQNVQIARTSPVSPGGRATVELGPCDKMTGYNFAIYVDGLAVDFDVRDDVERDQYPLEGSMNAWRSLELWRTREGEPWIDWDPALDIWEIGEFVP